MRIHSRLLVPFVGIALLMAPLAQAQSQPKNPGLRIPDRSIEKMPDQILVRFQTSASKAMAARVNTSNGVKVLQTYGIVSGLQLVQLPTGAKLEDVLAKYRSDPSVLYAEPNYIRKHMDGPPNDPYYHDLWNLHNIGQPILFDAPPISGPKIAVAGSDIHALEAWGITTGSSNVVVGVIDTGVDYTHEDLAANMYSNTADCNANGVDDDGNGYVDDCHGIDVLLNTGDPMDKVFHGTHVAGIIGAVGNNGVGVTGVNWNVKILACRFLDWYGGTDAGAIACLDYMAKMHDLGVNIVATNNSWGGYGYSQALYDAIAEQAKRGILFVAAAGNDSNDNDGLYPQYPASFSLPNLISVAATSFDDSLSYYSNFGSHTVDVGAPGDMVLSSTPGNTYTVLSGTSMATPHVTGIAALLKAQDPKRDWATIKNLILSSGDKLAALNETVTQRRVNAYTALTCNNLTVQSVVSPASTISFANVGQPLTLAALNANCGTQGGNVQVTVSPGGAPITLNDDGAAADLFAGDSVYSGSWTPTQSGLYTITFPVGAPITVAADPYSNSTATYQYRSIAGTKLGLSSENPYGWIDAPFPLSFGGGAFEGILVSQSGWFSFDSYGTNTSQAIPYKYANTLVAPFWDDLVSTGGGDVYWAVNGAAPNRELVIEWRKMGYNGCATDGSEAVTFQAVLFESRPDVLFNYADTSFGGTCTAHDRGASASIGVQTTTAVGKQSSLNTGAVQDSTAVSWTATLPSNTPPTITSLNPKSWYTDVFDTYIEVIGTKFTPQSVLLVNGSPRSTSVYNQGDAFAVLTAADIAKVGTLQLSMFNGLPNGGPSTPVSYTIAGDDFTLATSSSSMTVRLGQSNNITVYANPNPVYNDGISLSCSGLPVNATCTFDPARILPLGYSVMTITAKTSAAQPATPTASHRRLSPWGFATVGFVAAFAGVRSRKRALAVLMLAAFFSFAYIGCGGGGGSTSHSAATTTTTTPTNPTVTPSSTTGTFNVTITATSGSLTRTKIITVTLSQ